MGRPKLGDDHRRERVRLWFKNNRDRILEKRRNDPRAKIYKSRDHLNERHYVIDGRWKDIEGYNRLLEDGCDELHRKNKWIVHHRLEEKGFSQKQLKEMGLFYDRPPDELIWLTRTEHNLIHHQKRVAA